MPDPQRRNAELHAELEKEMQNLHFSLESYMGDHRTRTQALGENPLPLGIAPPEKKS
jgi:hypothetical protein